MRNVCKDPEYAEVAARLKNQLREMREELGETDKDYPRVQRAINEHWKD